MSGTSVVRNYAETLLALASREGTVDEYADRIGEVAAIYRGVPEFRLFLETPRVDASEKKRVLREAMAGRVPELFVRFLLVALEKRRLRLLPGIEEAYRELVDEREGRVHATVTLAREPDEELRAAIREELTRALGREVVPHYRTDPEILGGVVVRVGDRRMDGSLKRRIVNLRRSLLEAGGRGSAPSVRTGG